MLTPSDKRAFLSGMSTILRTSNVLAYFGGNRGEVARAFSPPLTRQAIRQWGEFVPELRARQLLEKHPDLQAAVLDPDTGRTRMEAMHDRLGTPVAGK